MVKKHVKLSGGGEIFCESKAYPYKTLFRLLLAKWIIKMFNKSYENKGKANLNQLNAKHVKKIFSECSLPWRHY
jgi:hypothetical protein